MNTVAAHRYLQGPNTICFTLSLFHHKDYMYEEDNCCIEQVVKGKKEGFTVYRSVLYC